MTEQLEYGNTLRLAQRLKTVRTVKRWNIRTLAERAGVSVGVISDLENGRTNPSIAILVKLCAALDLTVGDLFVDAPIRMSPVTAEQRTVLRAANGVTKTIVFHNKKRGFAQYEVRIEPGGSTGPGNIHSGCDEYIYVVHNEVAVLLGGTETVLRATESMEYISELEHQIVNRTDQPSVLHWTTMSSKR